MRTLLHALFLLFGVVTLTPAQSPICDASKDARIDKNNPGVYLSFERLAKGISPADTRLMEPSDASNFRYAGGE